MTRWIASAALSFALCGAAQAHGPLSRELIGWEHASEFYPERAQRLEIEGSAKIACDIAADRSLTGCVLIREWPRDFGFGQALLRLSSRLKASPDLARETQGRLTIPLKFTLDDHDRSWATYAGLHLKKGSMVRWLKQPTPDQIAAAYPEGETAVSPAWMQCRIDQTGHLTDCTSAAGGPFAAAALKLAPLFQAEISDPAQVGATVNPSLSFVPPDPEARKP